MTDQLSPASNAPTDGRPNLAPNAALPPSPVVTVDPALQAVLHQSRDGALVTDAGGWRIYSNPFLDGLVGAAACLPVRTASPPPYVPVDQHTAYWRLLHRVSVSLAGAGDPVSGSLELVNLFRERFRVHLTIASFFRHASPPVAIWLFRGGPSWGRLHSVDPPTGPTDATRSSLRALSGLTSDGRSGLDSRIPGDDIATLTRREGDVLRLLLDGRRVASIARSLFVSEHTVRNHLKAIFRKLDVHSQVELLERLRPVGLEGPDGPDTQFGYGL